MATTNLAATLTIPVSEPRPTTMDRILVIEDDGALRKVLRRLFSSEGYELDVVPANQADLDMFRQRTSRLRGFKFFVRILELSERFSTNRTAPFVVLHTLVGCVPLIGRILPDLQSSFDIAD
jgi:CheY-like chemotaxis protein